MDQAARERSKTFDFLWILVRVQKPVRANQDVTSVGPGLASKNVLDRDLPLATLLVPDARLHS